MSEWLDEDGYPTDDALERIEYWPYNDPKGWFEFIQAIWHFSSWGWKELTEPSDWKENTMVLRYYISTGGWSGNEDIIRAMQANHVLWSTTWVQTRRGGHYIFEVKDEMVLL
jgi:hypothetical protein